MERDVMIYVIFIILYLINLDACRKFMRNNNIFLQNQLFIHVRWDVIMALLEFGGGSQQ